MNALPAPHSEASRSGLADKNRIRLVGRDPVFVPRRKLAAKPRCLISHGLRLPIFVIAQEVPLVPEVHRRPEEQPTYPQVPHLLEAAVGGVNASAHDSEATA